MGRTKEFKVSKAFTIGIDEAQFLKVECERKGMKASALVNRWIREKMQGRVEEIREVKGPESYCHVCVAYKEYYKKGKKWLCEECSNDRTQYIEDIIRKSKY